jgi:hypothetical protein
MHGGPNPAQVLMACASPKKLCQLRLIPQLQPPSQESHAQEYWHSAMSMANKRGQDLQSLDRENVPNLHSQPCLCSVIFHEEGLDRISQSHNPHLALRLSRSTPQPRIVRWVQVAGALSAPLGPGQGACAAPIKPHVTSLWPSWPLMGLLTTLTREHRQNHPSHHPKD